MALTAKRVERLKKPGRYGDGNGLYLQVTNAENRSWIFRFERDGRERTMGLGPVHTVSLALAREKARAARLQLLDGTNPLEARRSMKAQAAATVARSKTFSDCAESFFTAHSPTWSIKHAMQWQQSILGRTWRGLPCEAEYDHCRALCMIPVAEVDTAAVLSIIEPLWSTTPETGTRVRGRIESVLAWATVRGYRSGPNPAQWKNHLDQILPARSKMATVKNFESVPYDQVPAFMATLATRPGSAARALAFQIMTAARPTEAREAPWSEINLTDAMWTISAERMKAEREHRVPLAPAVLALLRDLPPHSEPNDFVFPGPQRGKPLSDAAIGRIMQRMKLTAVPHGFRASFKTWAEERTSFPSAIIEMALAHAVGDATERAYLRSDLLQKRRALAEAWSRYCMNPAAVATGDNVVGISA
jgi:integrase